MNDKAQSDTGFLSHQERSALRSLMRKRKIPALKQRRANALLLLDDGLTQEQVAQVLYFDVGTVRELIHRFETQGSKCLDLAEYSKREGHLSAEQEAQAIAYFEAHPPRDCGVVRDYLLKTFDASFSRSGAIALMQRLGFHYKKPKLVPPVACVERQQEFIDQYEHLSNTLPANEAIVFADAVHPEHQARPSFGWFRANSQPTLEATSGRQRINIHGAINLETGQMVHVEGLKINAKTTKALLERIETAHPSMACIHVFLDNARYHHARELRPWLEAPDRRVKLHFLPAYCPHLNPIERLWGVMHKAVTHNQTYPSFKAFVDAIKGFLDDVQANWKVICDQISDNFRIIQPK